MIPRRTSEMFLR